MALLLIAVKTATDVHAHVKVMYFSYLQVEISWAESKKEVNRSDRMKKDSRCFMAFWLYTLALLFCQIL